MLLLFSHGIGFVKTKKTAGTSIELALSPFVGPHDIATPFYDDADERTRADTLAPRGHLRPVMRYGPRDLARLLVRGERAVDLYEHSGAAAAVAVLGPRWQALETFAVERNPWERLVSWYRWTTRHEQDVPAFDPWLEALAPRMVSNAYLYLDADENLLVDHLFDYPGFQEPVLALLARHGLEGVSLPHAKRGPRAQEPVAVSPASIEHVAQRCRWEIDHFGYEPPAELVG